MSRAAGKIFDRAPAVCDLVDHPSGFLALASRNGRFTVDGLPGLIAYREQGRHRVCLGGVFAPGWCREGILNAFLAASAKAGQRVTVVQLPLEQVALFRRRGFSVNQFGSTFALDLGRFTFAGTARCKLRNRIKRARDAGIRVFELGRDRPWSDDAWRHLATISAAWLDGKGNHELDFLVGELGQPRDPQRRIFVAHDEHDRPVAFITYVPAWGRRPGWLHDLTRRLGDCPTGVMELINATALARFQEEKVSFLHFGMTPFVVDRQEADAGSRIVARLVRLIGRWGSFIYPSRTQLQYKHKWAPDVTEREHIAFQKVSFGALWALLIVTGSLPFRRKKKENRSHEARL